jgi:hypothetical protein
VGTADKGKDRLMLMSIQAAAAQITQGTVMAILIASTLIVIGLLGLIGMFAWKTEKSLEYGNFFVVTLGILAALTGFLVAFPLLVSNVFEDPTQVLAILSALFGTIVGLVGTYFGVKSSSDARAGAERVATLASGVGTTTPTITVEPPDAKRNVSTEHKLTAIVISVDGSPAGNVPVTFTITAGPDRGHAGTSTTGTLGRASFLFTNGGTAGTDIIEAEALEGKGTATVTFE